MGIFFFFFNARPPTRKPDPLTMTELAAKMRFSQSLFLPATKMEQHDLEEEGEGIQIQTFGSIYSWQSAKWPSAALTLILHSGANRRKTFLLRKSKSSPICSDKLLMPVDLDTLCQTPRNTCSICKCAQKVGGGQSCDGFKTLQIL